MHADNATIIQPIVGSIVAMSAGRTGAFVAAVAALIGVVVGGLALARSAGRNPISGALGDGIGRHGANVATGLGLVGITLGAVVAATADGGVGEGNGLGGAVVAMVLGLIGVVVGGLTRARSRRPA